MAEGHVLLVEIVTPERIVYTNEVEMLVVPALDGEIGILPLHAPLVASLREGEVRVKYGKETEWFAVSGGYLQVHEDKAIVLADDAVPASQVDVERAQEAKRRAMARLAELRMGSDEAAGVEEDLRWCEVQVKVGEKLENA